MFQQLKSDTDHVRFRDNLLSVGWNLLRLTCTSTLKSLA